MSFEDALRRRIKAAGGGLPGAPLDWPATFERAHHTRASLMVWAGAAAGGALMLGAFIYLGVLRTDSGPPPAASGARESRVTLGNVGVDGGDDVEAVAPGVRKWVGALAAGDLHNAFLMLGPQSRRKVSYGEFIAGRDELQDGFGDFAQADDLRITVSPVTAPSDGATAVATLIGTIPKTTLTKPGLETLVARVAAGEVEVEPFSGDAEVVFLSPDQGATIGPQHRFLVAVPDDADGAGFAVVDVNAAGVYPGRLSGDGSEQTASWRPENPIPYGAHVIMAYAVDARGHVDSTAVTVLVRPSGS